VNIDIRNQGDFAVFSVQGRIDTVSAPELQERLLERISQGDLRLVVDFAGVDYISSAGLRCLMIVAKTARADGGVLACCSLSGVVKKVFDVSGFSALLPVYDTLNDVGKQ
jgi:anti-anti-sigma factor